MAFLTSGELARLSKLGRQDWITEIDFKKSIINDVFQAIEDWYEGERAIVSSLIDTASGPKSFNNAEKKIIAAAYLVFKKQ